MGVLSATVRFTGSVPTSTDLVAALHQHIGESVSYDEARGELSCPVLEKKSTIFITADPQQTSWELRTGHLDSSYLWYACLIVLERLGGVQQNFDGEDMPLMPAPIWAYKPWQLARKQHRWHRWRKYPYITLDEARRLDVE